jgi:hypothetical protein
VAALSAAALALDVGRTPDEDPHPPTTIAAAATAINSPCPTRACRLPLGGWNVDCPQTVISQGAEARPVSVLRFDTACDDVA